MKAGYKQTEVGVIPEDWEVEKLKKFAAIMTGNTPPTNDRSNYGDEYLFAGPGDLGEGKWISNTTKKLSKKGFDISRKFPRNSILFTCIGSTIGKIGIASKAMTSNQQINVILPPKEFSSDYLYYSLYMLAPIIKARASEQAVPIINKAEFGETLIPFPTKLSEQTAIATALSNADELIQSLEKLIAKKRLIKQGAMQELFKPKAGWVEKTLGDIGYTYSGLTGKSKKDFQNGIYPYIPFLNVLSNTVIDTTLFDFVCLDLNESQNKVLKGDLLFNTSSETPEEVGMCAVLLSDVENLYLNSFCFGFRFKSCFNDDGLYLSYYLRSSYGRKLLHSMAQGATRYNLSKNNFLRLNIAVPSLDEQQRIADILSDMDAELTGLEAKLDKYRQIKQGMMQELLTGRIRLE